MLSWDLVLRSIANDVLNVFYPTTLCAIYYLILSELRCQYNNKPWFDINEINVPIILNLIGRENYD